MSNCKTKLVIFDCDGVLFDSREANRHYYNALLRMMGMPEMDEEELDYCHSHTASESVDFLLDGDSELIERANELISTISYDQFLRFMKFEPAVRETVREIKKACSTAISTNRSTTMPLLVSMYGLNSLFDLIVCALDVQHPKPHPEGVFRILEYFRCSPDQALYVGDTVVDQQVAHNAGVPLIAYKNPNLDAMFHVEHFSEIKDIVFGLNHGK